MTHQGAREDRGALAVLELLAGEAPLARLESLMAQARRENAPEAELRSLERATRLGLSIHSQRERRQQREAGLSALLDTTRDLVAPNDLDTVLGVVTRRSRVLFGVDMSYISLPRPEDGVSYVRASDGHISTLNIGLRLPDEAGLGNAAMANLGPVWTPDYLDDSGIEHSAGLDEVVRAEGLRAIMAVPLSHGTRPCGVLYVADRNVRYFTRDEVSLISSLGHLAGLAIERAQVLDETRSTLRKLARENARTTQALQLARELGRIHRELVDQALSGAELHTLARAASRHLHGSLRIYAANGTPLTTVGQMPESEAAATAVATMDARTADEPVEVDGGMWAVPISAGREYLGTLLLKPEHPPPERNHRLLGLVARAAAVQLLLETSRTAIAQGRAHDELLEDLLAVPQRPPQQLEERARRLGIDLNSPHVVVIARSEGEAHGKTYTWASSYAHRMNGLKSVHSDSVVLFLPGTDPGAAASAVCDELSPLFDEPVTVAGAGPVSDAASVSGCHREALRCLDAMTALGSVGRSASARDLGFLGVLLADDRDVAGFVDSVIGPLLAYDRQRFTELARTLGAYFETGNSPTRAAQRLHVHPNTVARRLERVSDLLGRDWQQPERALEVQLALRLSRIRQVLMEQRAPTAAPGTADRA
ncbi:helix-turn-helix domain-containing protein [Streptomyces sp. TG1A-8]|uniref:helix-turn-helix domain-containing protein n=1 Tax=Streptomyces sp. TG1A-8 TaxID=3051385 RepID=UPI00265C602F|nr:helix-turn-helix domain-containing protein [Streptomyces sp. TG1A-8]MDO0925215.1 helix-turn-helix domain-containing protein [Streptomyces sp. TG1A-8]